MRGLCWAGMVGFVLTYPCLCRAGATVLTPNLATIKDGKTWRLINAECNTVIEKGKTVARLKPKGMVPQGSNIGLALVEELTFGEGTIEVDLKGKGKRETSFVGVAFSVVDGKSFEAVYFRPFNFMRDDPSFRAHAVQYIAWPQYTWENLRRAKPGRYESSVHPVPDPSGWFHARIEVTKQTVRVWVDDGKEPCLVVDRLVSHSKGKVGLWVDSKDGAFSELKISN